MLATVKYVCHINMHYLPLAVRVVGIGNLYMLVCFNYYRQVLKVLTEMSGIVRNITRTYLSDRQQEEY